MKFNEFFSYNVQVMCTKFQFDPTCQFSLNKKNVTVHFYPKRANRGLKKRWKSMKILLKKCGKMHLTAGFFSSQTTCWNKLQNKDTNMHKMRRKYIKSTLKPPQNHFKCTINRENQGFALWLPKTWPQNSIHHCCDPK